MADEQMEQDTMMPVFFIGHGNHMKALEDNEFTRGSPNAMADAPKPSAILFVSAHWLTRGTWFTAMAKLPGYGRLAENPARPSIFRTHSQPSLPTGTISGVAAAGFFR